jgi:Peptidase family M28
MRVPFILMLLVSAGAVPASAQTVWPDSDPRIAALVAAVSETRLKTLVETLAGFQTRNTLSDTSSPTRGIGAARQWIFDELKRSSPKLHVSFDTYMLAKQGRITRDVELRNVIAILPGRSARRIYVSAHYDTTNIGGTGQIGANTRPPSPKPPPDVQQSPDFDHNATAPGANDNGSGTALTMELARVFAESDLSFDATLVFALWAGEEQGLIGSGAHAERMSKDKVSVDADFNNDIVGNSRGGTGVIDAETVRVYSDGPEDSMSRSLARYIERMAAIYVPSHRVRLLARQDRFGRSSDNAPFNQRGFPAVVFREANENFSKQHLDADTIDGVDFAYLAQNVRVNLAGMASLALAPPAPKVTNERNQPTIGRQPSGYDANLRWIASPGAVGYRIYWREAWSPDWQRSQRIGDVTEFVLPKVSIDDFVFGVAAIGASGHESLVSAYVSPTRRDSDVKLVP